MEARFPTTHWSIVIRARDGADTAAREALGALCEAYWYPLYAYVRSRGHDAEEARDLTQGFFADLLGRGFLRSVDRAKGRFRSYLLASLKHFLSHERDRDRALKRGGGVATLSLDAEDAEGRFEREPIDRLTPEEIFERRWALTVLDHALDRLRADAEVRGQRDRFERLRQYLTGEQPHPSYREIAAELAMTEEAVKGAVLRMRRQLGRLLREEIGETVAEADQVDDEVRHLLTTLGRPAVPPP